MIRRYGTSDDRARGLAASSHRTPDQTLFAGGSNLRKTITMTNRK